MAFASSCAAKSLERAAREPPDLGKSKAEHLAGTPVRPARLFAMPESSNSLVFSTGTDGSRLLITQGMRLIEHADGSIERAIELLPSGRTRPIELPSRLGGGYLFAVHASSGTHLWRSATWVNKLLPLAHLDFEVENVTAGFDRLYVFDRRTSELSALDASSGQARDLGPLPSAPKYGSMSFADAWLGAVDVPFRGVLVSFDAGTSWRPLGAAGAHSVALEDGEIVVNTATGRLALDETGVLYPRGRGGEVESLFENAGKNRPESSATEASTAAAPDPDVATRVAPGPLGRRPLQSAVLHGWADSPTSALVADNGALVRVSLTDGKLMDVAEHAYPGRTACHAVRLGFGAGFVCGEERGKTAVYAFEPPLGMRRVLRFDEPRYVAASANGALVIRGSCGPEVLTSKALGTYCIRSSEGRLREIRARGDLGVERVIALSNDRAAVLVPPRFGAAGVLTVVDRDGSVQAVKLKLPKASSPLLALLRKGLWLDGFVELRPGELSGWVAGAGPFVGVRVKLDGRVTIGAPENDINRALLSGPFAIVFGKSGLAAETVDNGFTWREVELPAESAASDTSTDTLLMQREQGCSPVGCLFGAWLRVGWTGKSDKQELIVAETPLPSPRLMPGGGRWALSCAATGVASAGSRSTPVNSALTPARRQHSMPRAMSPSLLHRFPPEASRGSAWRPFFELSAPSRRSDEIGFDSGTEHKTVQLHGYAWGVRGANWDRVGKWQLYVADPFSIQRGLWSTAVSKSAWSDAAVAAQAFGADTAASSNWEATLDPGGRAGALVISWRGTVELFLFEEEHGIAHIEDAAKFGLLALAGAVKLGSTWYLGALGSQEFRVLKVEGTRLSLLAEYPLRQLGQSTLRASVVRNARGDALGIWARGVGWHVFPIDLESAAARNPLELPAAMLGRTPRACAADDEGWLLKTQPSDTGRDLLEPNIDFAGADAVRARNVQVRLMASAADLCVDALTAHAENAPPAARSRPLALPAKSSVPLILVDRGHAGRRLGYRCTL